MTVGAAVDLRRLAVEHLWMPFSNLADFAAAGGPVVIVRAEGSRLWDSDGKEYLDGIAAFEASQIGHGRERVARAVYDQILKVDMVESFRYSNEPAVRLAAKLAELAPGDLNRVLFSNGGAEAVEAAIKIARHVHLNRGETFRTKLLTREGSFHGTSFGAMAADGNYASTRTHLYEPLTPPRVIFQSTYRPTCAYCSAVDGCSLACADEVERAILREGPETVSAVIIDLSATAIGVLPPPPGYLARLREICDRYGVVLIADEIITGFGRTGRMFASERYGLEPDIMTVSKGLSSGYAPLAATIVSERLAQTFFDGVPLSHGQTFGGHPPSCAAALENIAIIEEEGLVERAARLEPFWAETLTAAVGGNPAFVEVRVTGLLSAVEFDTDRATATAVRDRCRDLGLIVLTAGLKKNAFFFCPPLVATEDELAEMAAILGRALDDVGVGRS